MGTTNAQTDPEHCNVKANPGTASIEAFFAESVIFITGATGFLGKALLEKLLRSCPRLATIYVLIRSKKGQSVDKRFSELLGNTIFDRIRWEFPGALNKVFPVEGDVSKPGLGLNAEDRAMLIQRVNMVFHSAATVRFDESLKVAVNLNTKGTDNMIELCKSMTNLISFVHVSTAYSNADLYEIKETIYRTRIKPNAVIDMCENLDDATLSILEKRIMGKHPNTYTLTKGLAEQLIETKAAGLPVAIVRPSIICAAYQEPFPGWIDNVCGITGIMMEIGRGTIRSIMCNADLVVDVIPVDFVVDTLICASWHRSIESNNSIKVYNCTSGAFNPIRWHEFGGLTKKHAIECPTKYVMWYPGFIFTTNKYIHKFISAMLHFLPAYIVDMILRCMGNPPVMLKVTKRFARAAQTGEFFALNEWYFHSENMAELVKSVKSTIDSKRFNIDSSTLDWDTFVHQYMLGIRKYLLKDDPDTLSNARNRLWKLYWTEKLIQVMGVLYVAKKMIPWKR